MGIEDRRLLAGEDRRPPHSGACGWRVHAHGPECHSTCPTCHGLSAAVTAAEPEPESDGELLARMGVDAAVWAAEFVRRHGGDEGLMIGWFANALEAGRAGARA